MPGIRISVPSHTASTSSSLPCRYLSTTGIPIVDLATEVIIGKKIRDLGYEPGLQPAADYYAS